MAVNKRLRFEIFKRDGFTCRYCGRRAPDVIIEVEHVWPKRLGGDDSAANLVTSCRDCNKGKSGVSLKTRQYEIDVAEELAKPLWERWS